MRLTLASLLVGLVVAVPLVGCAKPTATPEQRAAAKQFMLTDEPSGAVGILDYRESITPVVSKEADGEATSPSTSIDTDNATAVATTEVAVATEPKSVVLLGKIGGGKLTWSRESAEFVISDPALDLEAHAACVDDGCPFCKDKSNAEAGRALVRLREASGNILNVDARKVLPVEEGQMVVVRGMASVNAVGQLVVDADGIYIRR